MSLFASPKSYFLPLLCLALASCSSGDETPTCSYKSQPLQELKQSTAPELLGLAFQQNKLMELMWTPSSQSECFAKKNGGVLVFKTASDATNTTNTFVQLKPAPANSKQNWDDSQELLRGTLLGLTTFKFYSTPVERIVRAEILVLEDGRPWHLWHEYTHFLIGQLRVQSTELSLRNPKRGDLQNALNQAVTVINQPEEFQTAFNAYSDMQIDYMQKMFMDEILIEKTLQDLASQNTELLSVSEADFIESQNVIERFKEKYLLASIPQKREAEKILATLPPELTEQIAVVQTHLLRMEQQKSLLLTLAP